MTKYPKILLTIFLFTIYYLLFTIASLARAQTFSLGIYPPLLEVMIMPGKSVTQTYQISNSGDEAEITARIVKFKPADELGNIKLETGNWKLETQEWFSLENADLALNEPFLLKEGQAKQINLKINIPQDNPEEDYYFTLLFSTKPAEKKGVIGTRTAGVIGTNILLTVSESGQPAKKGEIAEFSLANCLTRLANFCLFDSFSKPKFLLRVENTGRTFWKPFGKIRSEGLLGQKWEQDLRPDNILAHSIRQIEVSTPSASPKILLGPYRATVEFALEENSEEKMGSSTSFLVLPFKAIIGLFLAVILLVSINSVFSRLKAVKEKIKPKVRA